jgi:hypothetical protein
MAGKWPRERSDEWLLMVPQNCHPERRGLWYPTQAKTRLEWGTPAFTGAWVTLLIFT